LNWNSCIARSTHYSSVHFNVTLFERFSLLAVDGKRSAQFEHTLVVRPDGVEALTAKDENSMVQFWEKNSRVYRGFWLGTTETAMKRADSINAAILDDL
jgi:hypothetical protein